MVKSSRVRVVFGTEWGFMYLTNAIPDRHAGGQADAEIEITPEMLQAGIDELLEYCPEQDEAKLVVRWIFEAMMRARV